MSLTIVTGPPCGGKTTHIATHATPGDIVIDLDRIALALTTDNTVHHDYGSHIRYIALQARAAAIRAALPAATGHDVWIIDSRPSRSSWAAYKQAGARHVTCNPGQHEVTRRAATQRPAWVLDLIADWYQT